MYKIVLIIGILVRFGSITGWIEFRISFISTRGKVQICLLYFLGRVQQKLFLGDLRKKTSSETHLRNAEEC